MTIARIGEPPSLNPLFEYDQPDVVDLTQLYAEPLFCWAELIKTHLSPSSPAAFPTLENGDISATSTITACATP